ncbi:uncharacterized protein LOC128985021 [Macrosteles quadrilineatus]|uniref:uncharacterized protein LOC128985021 n=1 Tax=Macrosteles quadrilineatus TaxID=74068 RepID=UPI0023E2611B|nr:uncharacterized protein LOC128985021 [Macrosteles quadrilineatus]
MTLNVSKCSSMTFSKIRAPYMVEYSITNQPLKRVSMVKDLGVIFSSDFSFDEHVDYLCKRANQLLGFLFRATRGLTNAIALKTLYCSLIRQLLEYASPVWSPFHLGSINKLEGIQKKYIRFLGARQGMQYREVPVAVFLNNLNLLDLHLRRCVADVVFLHKLLNGQIDCPALLAEVDLRVPSGTRSQDLFGKRHFSSQYEYHAPLARFLRLGNTLGASIDFFGDTTRTFRRKATVRLTSLRQQQNLL